MGPSPSSILRSTEDFGGVWGLPDLVAGHARRTPTRLTGREEAYHLPQAMTMDSNRCTALGEIDLLHHHLLLQARITVAADLSRRRWI